MFKKGDYVKSIHYGYIVLVDEVRGKSFSGTVVEGECIHKIGSTHNSWGVEFFKKINYKKNEESKNYNHELDSLPTMLRDKILNDFNKTPCNFIFQIDLYKDIIKEKEMENKLKVGDKVICIDDGDMKFLVKNEVYTVEALDGDYIYLQEIKSSFSFNSRLFNKISQYVKIVRNLEDLDGLKNDKGWELSFESTDNFKDKGYYQEWVRLDDKSDKGWFNAFYELSTKTIDLLIAGGFKFEYKPQRTEEEIMNDLIEKTFKFGEGNYILVKHEHGCYDYMNNRSFYIPGQKYYSLESLKKVVKELNDIQEG